MPRFFQRRFPRALAGALAATLLVSGLSACAHRSPDFGANLSAQDYAAKRDAMVDKIASRLDLNADQKKRLASLGDKLYEQRTALMGGKADPRAEMKALFAGNTFDVARAQALVNEKTAALQSKSPEVIAAMADFFNSLNPAQQQKVRDFLDRMDHGFHHG